jgi:Leu/Phe-tRNA-protein transferase
LGGYILLSKHHLERNVFFFDVLHISKTTARLIKEGRNFELRVDDCYDKVVERCVAKHGADWLTPPLLDAIRQIRADASAPVRPCSFALFHNGELCAGEFCVKVGSVYTSYSGYHDEASAGTVQMILTAKYLRDAGFAFLDAAPIQMVDIGIKRFTGILREARTMPSSIFFDDAVT